MLKVFIDSGVHSDDALKKFKQKQERKIIDCERKFLYGAPTLIGEAF